MAPTSHAARIEVFRLKTEIASLLSEAYGGDGFGYLAPTSLTWTSLGAMPLSFTDVDTTTLAPPALKPAVTMVMRAALARRILAAMNRVPSSDEAVAEMLRTLRALLPLCRKTHDLAWTCFGSYLHLNSTPEQVQPAVLTHRLACANDLLVAAAQAAALTWAELRNLGVLPPSVAELQQAEGNGE